MRTPLGTAALICGFALPCTATAATTTTPPTTAQIASAIKHAERSRQLWATVNVCHAPRFGIRAQIPALGFPATLSLTIQVTYLDPATHRFTAVQGVTGKVALGTQTSNLHQGGAIWKFTSAVTLSGTVTFKWRIGHKLIGETTRKASAGIKTVDHTDPHGTSNRTCTLPAATG
jgi:hypothetical protein